MVIAISAGGTLGHINPAISLIKKLKTSLSNLRIIFITTTKDEKLHKSFFDLLSNNSEINKIYFVEALGLSKKIHKLPNIILKDLKALVQIKKIIKEEKIDLLIGMGGYISGLSVYMANKQNIKTIIHEQNSIMGLANKINLKKTDLILLTYRDLKIENKYLDKVKIVINPRFIEARSLLEKKHFNNHNHILITSGTNGSKVMNEVVCEMINNCNLDKYTITYITGQKYYDEVISKINKKKNIYIKPFSNNLLDEIFNADLIISRAGSSTLFEILGLKKKSIIIPSPNVTNNHQYYNAKYFSDKKMINMINESNLNYSLLYDEIKKTYLNNNLIYLEYEDNLKFSDEIVKLIK